jgi:tRNA A-37 threonylcarbamoyl transferase component Bud32
LPEFRASSSPTGVLEHRVGGFRWLISESLDCAAWLQRLQNPQRLLQEGAERMKGHVVLGREIVRVRADGAAAGDVVIKHFEPRGLAEILKWACRASPAYRAFRFARQIQALGLITAAPLAAGERRCCGWLRESFLLTKHIPDGTPLYRINADCTDHTRRTGIARSLARSYAAMHDAGFSHRDPSQTNFLVVPRPTGGEAIALIDLDGLHSGQALDLTESARDLRRLLLRCRAPRRERAWFIAAYARLRRTRMDARQLVTQIGPLPTQASLPFCALREDGSPETSTAAPANESTAGTSPTSGMPTQIRRRGGLRWLVRSSHLTLSVETILSTPDTFLEQARVLKPSRSSAVSAREGLVLKRYNLRKWGNLPLDLFRGSRARRAFRKAYRLELCGIATARPIATADERLWFLPVRSYLLMEEIQGAVPLRAWSGSKPAACKLLADLLGRMHREGFTHRDLKGGNILFDERGQPHLIDLDGLRFIRQVSHERAIADLTRLAQDMTSWHWRPSLSQRACFLATYCRVRKLPDWRWWWREIEKRRR